MASLCLSFSLLEDGEDYGLFPADRKRFLVPGMVVYVQEFLLSHTSEKAHHFIGIVVLLWNFLVLQLSDGAVQLMD